uniref:Uncharacterized protein n=1 Tax=Anguilla anguilla TaxID=7936 RepID=A0A0E9RSL7_ANGAN
MIPPKIFKLIKMKNDLLLINRLKLANTVDIYNVVLMWYFLLKCV